MDFDAVITGDRAIQASFAKWPQEIHDSLYQRIARLTDQLHARVVASAPERTGNLKNEIIAKLYDNPESIKGVVTLAGKLDRNEYIKAAALEYGAHGTARVKKYRRTITEAFGRDISPTRINVKGYPRKVNIEEYAFLRGSLAGMEDIAVAEMTAAINDIVKE
jgi:hypothetical protein